MQIASGLAIAPRAASANLGRLAAQDEALDRILASRERQLLATTLPALLEKRFQQLLAAHQQALVDRQASQAIARGAANAGPLNSHMLVLRSLSSMRDLSPDYPG